MHQLQLSAYAVAARSGMEPGGPANDRLALLGALVRAIAHACESRAQAITLQVPILITFGFLSSAAVLDGL